MTHAEQDAEFVAVHGEDLAVFPTLVASMPDPFTGEHLPGKIIHTGVVTDTENNSLSELFGTNGRPAIELWGHQITELADRIKSPPQPKRQPQHRITQPITRQPQHQCVYTRPPHVWPRIGQG